MISLPETISLVSSTLLVIHLLEREQERCASLRQDLPYDKKQSLLLITRLLWWAWVLSIALLSSWIFVIPGIAYATMIAPVIYAYQILTHTERSIDIARPRTYLTIAPALVDQLHHMPRVHLFGVVVLGMLFAGPSRWIFLSCLIAGIMYHVIRALEKKFPLEKFITWSLLVAVISIWWYRF